MFFQEFFVVWFAVGINPQIGRWHKSKILDPQCKEGCWHMEEKWHVRKHPGNLNMNILNSWFVNLIFPFRAWRFFVDLHLGFLIEGWQISSSASSNFRQWNEGAARHSEMSQCIAICWNRRYKSLISPTLHQVPRKSNPSFWVGGCYFCSTFQNPFGFFSPRPEHALDTSSRIERYTNGTTRPGLSWGFEAKEHPWATGFWAPRKAKSLTLKNDWREYILPQLLVMGPQKKTCWIRGCIFQKLYPVRTGVMKVGFTGVIHISFTICGAPYWSGQETWNFVVFISLGKAKCAFLHSDSNKHDWPQKDQQKDQQSCSKGPMHQTVSFEGAALAHKKRLWGCCFSAQALGVNACVAQLSNWKDSIPLGYSLLVDTWLVDKHF